MDADAPFSDLTQARTPSGAGRVRTLEIYAIFTASGAAALTYQLLWARWLGLVFGNTAASISTVLAAFMLGLALGSWLAGRLLPRTRDPMLVYAILELLIGLFAVAFPLITGAVDAIFTAVIRADSTPALSLAVRASLAFSVLVIPTTLMGATLPLLTEFFRRDPRSSSTWKVGMLYATNTLGAALGTIAAGFLLIELIGIRGTTLVAAGLNFLVAIIGFRYSRSTRLQAPTVRDFVHRPQSALTLLTLLVLACSGAAALASEVLWTRVLELLIGNSTYAFSMILVLFLLGIATGSAAASRVVNRLSALPLWLGGLQMAMGAWTLAAIVLFYVVSYRLRDAAYQELPLGALFLNHLEAVVLLFPLALLSGATFTVATRILDPEATEAEGTLIARAYTWNTLGAVAGSLIAGFGIAVLFDFIQSIYLLAALYGAIALAAAAAVLLPAGPKKAGGLAVAVLALVVVAAGFAGASKGNRMAARVYERYETWRVLFHQPGLQGVTTVLGDPKKGGEALLINGNGVTAKVTDTKMMAHVPMLAHPEPSDTLVIGFGMGTTYRSAISHGGRVTVVELVGEVLDAFDYFHSDAQTVRRYPRGRMVINDGRNFLKITRERYDVITIDPPPPIDAAGVSSLYSREFLELAKSRLKPGGIMAHWVPYPGTSSGVDDDEMYEMLVNTFAAVFPHAWVLPSLNEIGSHLLGSVDAPIALKRRTLIERLENTAVVRDLNEWDTVSVPVFLRATRLEAPDENVALETDDTPSLEFNLIRSLTRGTRKLHPNVSW